MLHTLHPSKLNININIFSVKLNLVKYVLSYHDKHLVDNNFPFIQIQALIFHIMCSYRLHNPAKY